MSRKPDNRRIVDQLMAEPCIYGGLLATRGEVYEDLQEVRGPQGQPISHLMIDRLVWMCPAIKPGDPVPSLTLKQVRQDEANRNANSRKAKRSKKAAA